MIDGCWFVNIQQQAVDDITNIGLSKPAGHLHVK